ncbi:MAG: hypothetical protein HY391_04465 [Deltaproteobacteria bacterium]|nr:hypothetical protein [Deltaproteobacteria bacterium]
MKGCKLLLGVALLLLMGCNEYKVQICTEANRVDIPGLEGEHTVYLQDPVSLMMHEEIFSVERAGVGLYSAAGVVALYTCKFGEKILVEAQNLFSGQDTYSSYFLSRGEDGMDLVVAAFDREKLSREGVTFTVEPRTLFGRMDYHVLNVDNQNIAPEEIAQFLHPTSIVIKVY